MAYNNNIELKENNNKELTEKGLKESPLFSWEAQDMHGLGMSGLREYDEVEFVDVKTGKVHFSTYVVIEKDVWWSSDGERVLFNGFLYDILKEEEEPCFVVLDVKNKRFLSVYKGYAEHPRWNHTETDAVFDNVLAFDNHNFAYLQRSATAEDLWRNFPVIHLENEPCVKEDGRLYVGESVSPNKVHKVRFYKVGVNLGKAFKVRFWVYRKKCGLWAPLRWAMSDMVNGVDGLAWVDDNYLIYTDGGSRMRHSYHLNTLDFLS